MTRTSILFLLLITSIAQLNGTTTAAESPGIFGIQYGSGDFKRPQNLLKENRIDLAYDDFGSEWSLRLHGAIIAPVTGRVRIQLTTNEDARLRLGNKILLDSSDGQTLADIEMMKGKRLPLTIELRKDSKRNPTVLKLEWSYDDQPLSVIGEKSLVHSEKARKEFHQQLADTVDDDDDRPIEVLPSAEKPKKLSYLPKTGIGFHQRAGEMDISIDGKLFATYVWSDPRTTRPYFKQIHALGGNIQVTRNHPPLPTDFYDHETYHPGIWWGFGDVGGNDYWRMKAKIIGGSFVDEPTVHQNIGHFAVRNQLLTNGSDVPFGEQICRYSFRKTAHGILMICESTFRNQERDFWLGDQEEMGLAFRVAKSLCVKTPNGGMIRDSENRTALKAIRTNQADWCEYSGPVFDQTGKKHHGGLVLMNDPANFRKPWWHAVDTGLLVANPLGENELNGRGKKRENVLVKKGEPFRLKYGILVHSNDSIDQFSPASAYKEFLRALSQNFNDVPPTEKSQSASDLPQVPTGFEISIFASEPRVYKPTSLCFDSHGRLMVGQGPQYPRNLPDTPPDSVVLVLDTDQDGQADTTKTFATGFNSIQSLAWKGNDLYVANAPELTVVRDLDGDDEADEYVVLYTDLGNREHALHGLTWGPDGRLYMSKGNSKGHNQPEKYGYVAPRPFRELWDVEHPPGAPDAYPPKTHTKHSYRKSYHHWSDDWGREGGVLRCDPMGTNLEIVARGMRNPWDITLDDQFNWLGTDNDQDQGDRIIMPFFGAHFGWGHSYSSHWTGDNHLATAPISGPVFHGSGTGIAFYSHPHFPAKFRNVFFINDWLRGTYLYRPTWDGALMLPANGRWEQFVKRGNGKLLYRPTDLEFAPDGTIYICGWGGDYHYDPADAGSWLFQISHGGKTDQSTIDSSRARPYSAWSVDELIADLGPASIPVWRVNAQDELVRRGDKILAKLESAVASGHLHQGQQTWALWAIGRNDKRASAKNIDQQMCEIITSKSPSREAKHSLNLRLQAVRILAFRIQRQMILAESMADVQAAISVSLKDPEPRIRFESVQAIWQANLTDLIPPLIDRLAIENDRVTYYAGWQSLRRLISISERKQLLQNQQPRVRLAALLSLQEGHELTLDEAVRLAEVDSDEQVQNWALTWAMNPRPPQKMPNTQSRIELEESVSVRDLIKKANKAKSPQVRRVYLRMLSRATYRNDKDWDAIHQLYGLLESAEDQSLLIRPLARKNQALDLLWAALAGEDQLQQAAINGFVSLSRQDGNSAVTIADDILQRLNTDSRQPLVSPAMIVLSRLQIPVGWTPIDARQNIFASAIQNHRDSTTVRNTLITLLSVKDETLRTSAPLKGAIRALCQTPEPQFFTLLQHLNQKANLAIDLPEPQRATVGSVIEHLPMADAKRGKQLFFDSSTSGTNCASCHRISGRGTSFAPNLSGVGTRLDGKKLAQSILQPSATITEGYQQQTIVTNEGLTFVGAVLQDNGRDIRLVTADGNLHQIPISIIEHRETSQISAMPSGFDLLGDAQVADLVKYLLNCREEY